MKARESANKLLLSPGSVQIYYGDETARPLVVQGTQGDATLRSFMNWDDLAENDSVKEVHSHWQKLGQFRKNHLSVKAGNHQQISESPYVFSRALDDDQVVVGLDLSAGEKTIPVSGVFSYGTEVTDFYSNKKSTVSNGIVTIDSPYDVVLIER